MAKKTQRRGRRHQARAVPRTPPAPPPPAAPVPPAPSPVVSRETEEARLGDAQLWLKLTQPLHNVLSMRSDDAFVDAERLCPREAFLVIHLDKRLASDPPDALDPQRETLTRMLSAVMMLCEWAERLRQWDDLSLVFWSNVLGSRMLESVVDSAWISKWARFVKAHGVRLVLCWNGFTRRLETLQGPLDHFLFEHHAQLPSIVLELEACGLSVENIRWLHTLLKNGGSASEETQFVRVQGLYLNGNTFHTDGLNALAELLEDPDTTLIDELQLQNTMSTQVSDLVAVNYVAAFRRVLAAVFTSKGSSDSAGVSLSLGYHNNFRYEHVDALYSALRNASRPLKMLSLANVRIVGDSAIKQLGRLLFSPYRTVNNGSDLNISGIGSTYEHTTLAAVYSALPDLVNEAIVQSSRVECLCFAVDVFRDEAMTELFSTHKLHPHQFYAVHTVGSSGRIGIMIPAAKTGSDPLLGWIYWHSIVSVRSADGQHLVGWNFSGLIADGAGDSMALCMRLLPAAGVHLQRLALRGDRLLNWNPETVALLENCVNLQQLNLSKSSVYENFRIPFWDRLSPRLASSLRVLDISDCFVQADSVSTLAKFSRLRYLSLRGMHSDWQNRLEKLLYVLRKRRSLQYVEMDYPPRDVAPCAADPYIGSMYSMGHSLRRLSIADDVKTAFLSVLTHLETRHPSWKSVNEEVVIAILQYAGVVSSCVVNWTSPHWLKTSPLLVAF